MNVLQEVQPQANVLETLTLSTSLRTAEAVTWLAISVCSEKETLSSHVPTELTCHQVEPQLDTPNYSACHAQKVSVASRIMQQLLVEPLSTHTEEILTATSAQSEPNVMMQLATLNVLLESTQDMDPQPVQLVKRGTSAQTFSKIVKSALQGLSKVIQGKQVAKHVMLESMQKGMETLLAPHAQPVLTVRLQTSHPSYVLSERTPQGPRPIALVVLMDSFVKEERQLPIQQQKHVQMATYVILEENLKQKDTKFHAQPDTFQVLQEKTQDLLPVQSVQPGITALQPLVLKYLVQ